MSNDKNQGIRHQVTPSLLPLQQTKTNKKGNFLIASIKFFDLRPSAYDLLGDSESFLDDLSDKDLATINGGRNDIEITITVIVIVYIEIR